MTLRKYPFKKIVGKGENVASQHFLLFLQSCLPFLKQSLDFSYICRLQIISI